MKNKFRILISFSLCFLRQQHHILILGLWHYYVSCLSVTHTDTWKGSNSNPIGCFYDSLKLQMLTSCFSPLLLIAEEKVVWYVRASMDHWRAEALLRRISQVWERLEEGLYKCCDALYMTNMSLPIPRNLLI